MIHVIFKDAPPVTYPTASGTVTDADGHITLLDSEGTAIAVLDQTDVNGMSAVPA